MSTVQRKKRIVKLQESRTVSWDCALEEFLLRKKAEGKSERTIKDYGYHVRTFFKRYPDDFSDDRLFKRSVVEYMAEDAKPAYYNKKLVYLKIFFNWCLKEKIITENPLADFKRRKADERIVQIDGDTLKRLLSLPDQSTFPGLRDYALLLLQLDTGIRPKEALALLVSDINFRSLEVYVRAENAKTRIARTLPISSITAKAIQKVINVRPSDWTDDVPVFCTCEGAKFGGNGWYKRVSEYGQKLGIVFYPYQLRHTFALNFIRNGGDSFALQKVMGHADLNMTKKYVAMADNDIKEQHQMASPVANLVQPSKRVRNIK